MSMSDPIGDMLTRIRNALAVNHASVACTASRVNALILDVMLQEGYIRGYQYADDKRTIKVALKYYAGKAVIEYLHRVSKPGLRSYSKAADLKPFMNGLGIVVVSTSHGVMTDHQARSQKLGGEVICQIA